MPDPQLARLAEILDLLRSKGVRIYRGAVGLDSEGRTEQAEIEFEPTVIDHPDAKPAPDPDRCACGHMAHEHGDGGLCLHGCDPSSCSPPEEAPK
jgi:hypothetical protein